MLIYGADFTILHHFWLCFIPWPCKKCHHSSLYMSENGVFSYTWLAVHTQRSAEHINLSTQVVIMSSWSLEQSSKQVWNLFVLLFTALTKDKKKRQKMWSEICVWINTWRGSVWPCVSFHLLFHAIADANCSLCLCHVGSFQVTQEHKHRTSTFLSFSHSITFLVCRHLSCTETIRNLITCKPDG